MEFEWAGAPVVPVGGLVALPGGPVTSPAKALVPAPASAATAAPTMSARFTFSPFASTLPCRRRIQRFYGNAAGPKVPGTVDFSQREPRVLGAKRGADSEAAASSALSSGWQSPQRHRRKMTSQGTAASSALSATATCGARRWRRGSSTRTLGPVSVSGEAPGTPGGGSLLGAERVVDIPRLLRVSRALCLQNQERLTGL
jgi:hypothetical protein